MSVAYRSKGSKFLTTSGSTATVTTPTGFQAGDLLLCSINIAVSSGTPGNATGLPSGWTLLDGGVTGTMGTALYYKLADGSEGANEVWTGFSGTFAGILGYMMAFTGCDTTTPIISGQHSGTRNTTTTATQTHPSVTATVAGSGMFLYRACRTTSSRTFTTNMPSATTLLSTTYSASQNSAMEAFFAANVSGAQSYTTTANTSTTAGNGMYSCVLAAAAGGGGGPTVGDSVGILMG